LVKGHEDGLHSALCDVQEPGEALGAETIGVTLQEREDVLRGIEGHFEFSFVGAGFLGIVDSQMTPLGVVTGTRWPGIGGPDVFIGCSSGLLDAGEPTRSRYGDPWEVAGLHEACPCAQFGVVDGVLVAVLDDTPLVPETPTDLIERRVGQEALVTVVVGVGRHEIPRDQHVAASGDRLDAATLSWWCHWVSFQSPGIA
jgi:hypothetical protein